MRERALGLVACVSLSGCGATAAHVQEPSAREASASQTSDTADRADAPPVTSGKAFAASEPRGSAALGDGTYRILLDRREREGEERRVESRGREVAESTFFEGGRRVQQGVEVTAVRFEGRCLTRRVNAVGHTSALSCQVETLEDEAAGRELVPSGTKLVLERDRKRSAAKVTLDGRPASNEVRAAVDLVLGLSESTDSDDAVFGSDAPRRVGEKWSIDGGKLAQRLEQQLAATVARPPTGEVELVGATEVAAIPALHLRARVGVTELTSKDGTSRFTTTVERKLPLDLAERVLWQSNVGEFQVKRPVPERPSVTLELKLMRTMEQTSLPIE